jgi:hypothetical protein
MATRWSNYYARQVQDPEMRELVGLGLRVEFVRRGKP